MKHFPLFKNISLTCLALASVAVLGSCTTSSPTGVSSVLKECKSATVFSYNDTSSPKVRECVEAGPLPARAANALSTWLRLSTRKSFSYTYPQYYVAIDTGKGRPAVWGLCSDAQGNLVGVMIPRNGVPAWDIPYASEHTMYVCETSQRKELSKAIMDSLADAGYDEYRLGVRRASGLTQDIYLISKPLTDAEQKRLEKFRAARAAAAAAQANKGSGSDTSAVDTDDDDFSFGGSDDDDSSSSSSSSDDDTSDEDAAADSSDDAGDSGDEEESGDDE